MTDYSGWIPFISGVIVFGYLLIRDLIIKKMFAKGQYEQLIKVMDKKLNKNISFMSKDDLFLYKACGHYYLGEFRDAVDCFSMINVQTKKIKPLKEILYYYLMTLFLSGQTDKFVQKYNQSEEILKSKNGNKYKQINTKVKVLTAVFNYINGNLEESRNELKELLKQKDKGKHDYSPLHYLLSLIYDRLGDNESAILELKKVITSTRKETFLYQTAQQKIKSVNNKKE